MILKNSPGNRLLILFFVLIFSSVYVAAETRIQEESLFNSNCSNCHGQKGEGFLKLYPPIRNSRFLNKDLTDLPCIIRYGLRGEIEIDGQLFNQVMPGNKKLSPTEIAEIILYMQNSWGHGRTELNIEQELTQCH